MTDRLFPIDAKDAEAIRGLWDAANFVVGFHAPEVKSDNELSEPHRRLRDAVMVMVERDDLLRAVER